GDRLAPNAQAGGGVTSSAHNERIADRETIDGEAVVHVFGIQNRAAGKLRGGDDQSIEDIEPESLRQCAAFFVRLQGDRNNLVIRANNPDKFSELIPGKPKLATSDRYKLVQHLDAYDSTARQQIASSTR